MTARRLSGYGISKWTLLFVIVVGVGSLAFYLWHAYAIRQAHRWPTTEATVINCQVTSVTNLIQGKLGNRVVRDDHLGFAFTYRVSGREYVSRRFYVLGHPPANIVAHDFPVGRRFLASYSASSPDVAVVEPGPLYFRVLVLAVVFLGLGGAGIVYNHYQR